MIAYRAAPARLAFSRRAMDNPNMEAFGRVQNGVVVLDSGTTLPEGTRVFVSPVPAKPAILIRPGELPVVLGGEPASVHLTNERISQILDDEDAAALKHSWHVPA